MSSGCRERVDERPDWRIAPPVTWREVRDWRHAKRAALLAQRAALPQNERQRVGSIVRGLLRENFSELRHTSVGFYWPFKGEIDLRPLLRDLLGFDGEAALPVVVEKGRPLEFWNWHSRMTLARGIWDIPIPAKRSPVRPMVLLVPLLGFAAGGYRLGYGGGYYDRTLASMDPKPLTIGVGHEFGRLKTIYPQPHDIPLDAIVTETGCVRFTYRGRHAGVATPNDPHRDACERTAVS